MAVIRLLVVFLSVFLLLVTGAVAGEFNYAYTGDCDPRSRGCDVETVRIIVQDLAAKVPGKQGMRYCNVLTSSSTQVQVFGYAYCDTGSLKDPTSECVNCLAGAGVDLIKRCGTETGGAGQVWGSNDWCYLQIGTTNCASLIH